MSSRTEKLQELSRAPSGRLSSRYPTFVTKGEVYTTFPSKSLCMPKRRERCYGNISQGPIFAHSKTTGKPSECWEECPSPSQKRQTRSANFGTFTFSVENRKAENDETRYQKVLEPQKLCLQPDVTAADNLKAHHQKFLRANS